MMRPAIPVQIAKLLPLLSSDQDGEVVAAARAVCRTLQAAGLDIHDLARAAVSAPRPRAKRKSAPSWQAPSGPINHDADAIADCLRRAGDWLPEKDRNFLATAEPRLRRWGGRLSLSQRAWLNDIRQRIAAREAA